MFKTLAHAACLTLGMLILVGDRADAADSAEGKKVFTRQCTACHIDSAEGPRRLGPSLFGIVGRKTGTVEGFRYTEANLRKQR